MYADKNNFHNSEYTAITIPHRVYYSALKMRLAAQDRQNPFNIYTFIEMVNNRAQKLH